MKLITIKEMKFLLCLVLIIWQPLQVFSQSRMVLNDSIFINIKNNAYLVIDNPNANAISEASNGGNIISEGEFNMVQWIA